MTLAHQRAREIVVRFGIPYGITKHLGQSIHEFENRAADLIAAALVEEREATVREVYEAIHALHKGGTLEHCWYQACECEKIWKAVKAVVLTERQRKGARHGD